MRALSGLDFELVLATNQDGLGTPSFPEATFRPAHERMLATLEGEGVRFDDQLIDRTFEADDAPTRKPRTGMFGRYLDGSYDLAASYVVGDRPTDMLLARNLGARGILLAPDEGGGPPCCAKPAPKRPARWSPRRGNGSPSSSAAANAASPSRAARPRRKSRSRSTSTAAPVRDASPRESDSSTTCSRRSPTTEASHSRSKRQATCGSTSTTPSRMSASCSARRSTVRWAARRESPAMASSCPWTTAVPWPSSTSGGRIGFEWEAEFRRERIGELPTEMLRHFFHAFACAARCNLHVAARGDNEHHKAEAIFKAFARALRMAVARIPFAYDIPSSKGVL